jgi:DNA-damage-inducible protein D
MRSGFDSGFTCLLPWLERAMAGTEASLFHFDDDRPSFEDAGHINGITHWDEPVLMSALGYEDQNSFRKVVLKAKKACLTAGLGCEEHFRLQPDGSHFFTRFGCYLVAMNGSPAKPQVAAAQAYFASIAQAFKAQIEHADAIDRMLIRDELTDGQKSLASTAKHHGVENYAFFQDKGYMGLYNMRLRELCVHKGATDGPKLMDRMGKAELAANLFRITQTDVKINNENIRGQTALERAAFTVGRTVRQAMISTGGSKPEELPLEEDIKDVKKKLKGASKALKAKPPKPEDSQGEE